MKRTMMWGLAGLAFVGMGCGGSRGSGIIDQSAPRIRAVDAMNGQPTLNWQVTGQSNVNFQNLVYGQLSNPFGSPYVVLNQAGNQTVTFLDTGNPPTIVATYPPQLNGGGVQTHDFSNGDKNTAIAYGGTGGAAGVVFLYDQTTNSTNGPNLRFVNAAQQQGTVDLFITPITSIQKGSPTAVLPPGTAFPPQPLFNFAYVALQTGQSYTITVYPQGHDTGLPLVTDQLGVIAATGVLTLVLVDPQAVGTSPTILPIQDNNAGAD